MTSSHNTRFKKEIVFLISRNFYLDYCYYNTSMEKSIYKKARAKIEFSICESPCPWWHRPRKCWNHVRPKPICCRRRKRKQRGSNHLHEYCLKIQPSLG